MDPSEDNSAGGSRKSSPSSSKKHPKRKDPRPTDPPKVSQESHKIKKPAPKPFSPAGTKHHHTPTTNTEQDREPSITNDNSEADSKDLAQPLTSLPSPGDVDSAARTASIEETTEMPITGRKVDLFSRTASPVRTTTKSSTVPAGFFHPEFASSPVRDALISLYCNFDYTSKTETVPSSDASRSRNSSLPSQSSGSRSSAMVSSPPVTETVPITTVPNSSSGSLSSDTVSSPPLSPAPTLPPPPTTPPPPTSPTE